MAIYDCARRIQAHFKHAEKDFEKLEQSLLSIVDDTNERTPLHMICWTLYTLNLRTAGEIDNVIECVHYFAKNGVNVQTAIGHTPLHLGTLSFMNAVTDKVRGCIVLVLKTLLHLGASPRIANADGVLPLDRLAGAIDPQSLGVSYVELVNLFLDYKATSPKRVSDMCERVRTGNYGRPLQCVYGPFTTYGRDIPRDEQFERDIRLAEERPNLSVYLKDFDVLEKNYTDDCDFTEPDTYYFLLRPQLLFELLFE